jgi:hypothetical protein
MGDLTCIVGYNAKRYRRRISGRWNGSCIDDYNVQRFESPECHCSVDSPHCNSDDRDSTLFTCRQINVTQFKIIVHDVLHNLCSLKSVDLTEEKITPCPKLM